VPIDPLAHHLADLGRAAPLAQFSEQSACSMLASWRSSPARISFAPDAFAVASNSTVTRLSSVAASSTMITTALASHCVRPFFSLKSSACTALASVKPSALRPCATALVGANTITQRRSSVCASRIAARTKLSPAPPRPSMSFRLPAPIAWSNAAP